MFKNLFKKNQPDPVAPTVSDGVIQTSGTPAAPGAAFKIMDKNEQQSLLKERRKVPISILILKIVSLLMMTVMIISLLILEADLHPENRYLQYFGLKENTILKYNFLKKSTKQLTKDNKKNLEEIALLKDKIKNKKFYLYDKQIASIRKEQLQWFDEDQEDGFTYGIIDSIDRMREYFTSPSYKNKEIQFVLNKIEIQSMSFNRNEASFSIKASNVDGNVFSLTAEFIKMMNSFDFFTGAAVRNFTRQELADGDMGTSFSIKLRIQDELEYDPADEYFEDYLTWEKEKNKTQSNSRGRGVAPRPN